MEINNTLTPVSELEKRPQGQPPKFGDVPNLRVSFIAPEPLIAECQKCADDHFGGNRSDVILAALRYYLSFAPRSGGDG